MKTFEVDDDVATDIEEAAEHEITRLLRAHAQEFIDVTTFDIPPNQKVYVHTLTGKKLWITAQWLD